jgi:hypothetical protein
MRLDHDDEFWEDHSVARPADPVGLVDEFERLINRQPHENEIQNFLEMNPWLLAQQFAHCHYVLPQFSFGGQFRADFVLPERCSGETIWFLTEIERPDMPLLARNGEFSKEVRHAIGQVQDWMHWLRNNQDTARKPRTIGGLGLHDISSLISGYVVIGRRSKVCRRFNQLRSTLLSQSGIDIVTYDRIIDWARNRAQFWSTYSPKE